MPNFAIIREGAKDNRALFKNGKYLRDIDKTFVKKDDVVFVGMYTYREDNETYTVYSLPKYYPENKCTLENLSDIQSHIKIIAQVVEGLRKNGKTFDDSEFIFDPYEQNSKDNSVSRYELAEFIIEDYLQNGLYIKDQTETKKNGIGRTLWGKTVNKIQPFIQDNIPIYLKLMNKHHITDENDLMTTIHANVLNQCLDFLGPQISNGMNYIDTEQLENLSDYSNEINSRLTYIFKEREINLFKALEAWCKSTRYYKNYAGVTCFDRVWEWVNDSVWGNIKNPKSKEPKYYISNECYSGKGEAIPDTIRIEKKDDNDYVFIFDSKYYVAKNTFKKDEKNQIVGFPANSDIVKQVAYLKLIKSQYNAKNFYNSFLLPEYHPKNNTSFEIPQNKWFSVIGYVEPGDFELDLVQKEDDDSKEKINEKKVGIIIENPEKLYDKFLKGQRASNEELNETKKYLSL